MSLGRSFFPSVTIYPDAALFPSMRSYLYPAGTASAEASGAPSLVGLPYKIQPAGTPSAEASGSSALIWAREAIQAWPDGVGVPRRTLTPGPGRLPGSPDDQPHVYRRIQFPSANIFPSADLYPYADPASPRSLSGYALVVARQAPMVARRVARQLKGVCTVLGGGAFYVLGVKSSDYADNVTRVYLPANTRRLHLTSERKRLDLGGRTVRLSIDT